MAKLMQFLCPHRLLLKGSRLVILICWIARIAKPLSQAASSQVPERVEPEDTFRGHFSKMSVDFWAPRPWYRTSFIYE